MFLHVTAGYILYNCVCDEKLNLCKYYNKHQISYIYANKQLVNSIPFSKVLP